MASLALFCTAVAPLTIGLSYDCMTEGVCVVTGLGSQFRLHASRIGGGSSCVVTGLGSQFRLHHSRSSGGSSHQSILMRHQFPPGFNLDGDCAHRTVPRVRVLDTKVDRTFLCSGEEAGSA
eukprot:gene22771-29938_t